MRSALRLGNQSRSALEPVRADVHADGEIQEREARDGRADVRRMGDAAAEGQGG